MQGSTVGVRAVAERYGRQTAAVPVRVGGRPGVITSLSETGIFVSTDALLAAGDEVTVTLLDAPFAPNVRADVRYRRGATAQGGAGVALQFLPWTAGERAAVTAFLAAARGGSSAHGDRRAPLESGVLPVMQRREGGSTAEAHSAAELPLGGAKILPFRPSRAPEPRRAVNE